MRRSKRMVGNVDEILDSIQLDEEDNNSEEIRETDKKISSDKACDVQNQVESHDKLKAKTRSDHRRTDHHCKSMKVKKRSENAPNLTTSIKTENDEKLKSIYPGMNRKRKSKPDIKPIHQKSDNKSTNERSIDHKIQLTQFDKFSISKKISLTNPPTSPQPIVARVQPNNYKIQDDHHSNNSKKDADHLKVADSVIRMHSSNENLNSSSSDDCEMSGEEMLRKYLEEQPNDEESKSNSLPGWIMTKRGKNRTLWKKYLLEKKMTRKSNSTGDDWLPEKKLTNDEFDEPTVDQSSACNSDEYDEFCESNLFYKSPYGSKDEYLAERLKMFEQNKNKDYLKPGRMNRSLSTSPSCNVNSKGGILQVFIVVIIAVIVMKFIALNPKTTNSTLNCPLVNGESSSSSSTVNHIKSSSFASINEIESCLTTDSLHPFNGMHNVSPLDLNNNNNNSHPYLQKNCTSICSASSVIQQQQLTNFNESTIKLQTTSGQINKFQKKFIPLNLITESEPLSPTFKTSFTTSLIQTRPPVLKDQSKTGSQSSTTSSGISGSSSFDSTNNLSVENLATIAGYHLIRTDSVDKISSKLSKLTRTYSHGKIARIGKLARNQTDHKISNLSLNKIQKTIGQRSQSQDEMNYNNIKNSMNNNNNNIMNNKTGSTCGKQSSSGATNTNVSNMNSSVTSSLSHDLEKLKQQQEMERRMMLAKFQEEHKMLLEQHEKKLQEKKRNQIQNQDFATNQIIEEEHHSINQSRNEETKEKENNNSSNLSSSSTASPMVRQRLRDNLINKLKREQQNGAAQPGGSISGQANWTTKLKHSIDLHPLKKAASEPNLIKVKSQLKQRTHRRCSPHTLLRKKQKRFGTSGKGPAQLIQSSDSTNTHSAPVSASSSMESSTPPNSKPESIPGSPPTYICGSITTGNSASSTPHYNEPSSIAQSSPFNDNHLYSSPSLPNISRHHPNAISDLHRRFYPTGSSSITSPTQHYYQKLKQQYNKQRLEHTIEKESSNLVGSIASNQSFINDQAFINSTVASAFRRTHCSPLLSNSLDSGNQRDSPPAASQNLRNQLESSAHHSTQYSPYAVGFKPLNSRKLNRTQSAPLPFGLHLLQKAAALNNGQQQQQQQQSHFQPTTNIITSTPSTTASSNLPAQINSSIDTHQFVMQKMKQQILTKKQAKQNQKSFGNLGNKPSSISFDETPSCDKKMTMFNEVNLDSGSGSFDENYNENVSNLDKETLIQQRQLLEQIQQQFNQMNQPNNNQTAITTEQLSNRYQELMVQRQLMMILQQKQQQQQQQSSQQSQQSASSALPLFDPSILNSIFNQQQQQALNSQYLNYAKLAMSTQYLQQANGLKRAISQPMVSPAPANQFYSNQLFTSPNAAATLLSSTNQQPSLTSLVAPFSGLNLSHSNINLISNQSGHNSPDHHLISENSTALVTDEAMLKHDCTCGNPRNHLESSDRLLAIIKRLYETGLTSACVQLPARKATIEELESVHSSTYCQFFANEPTSRQRLEASLQLNELPIKSYIRMNCGGVGIDNDTIFNEQYTWSAVRAAAGCVIDLASLVAKNKLKNGFAIVRPPGHHAEYQNPAGFCYFNQVAIAAKQLKLKHGLNKILILDFDVHHGNGTQKTFYDDEHVLYISLHRHDEGNFYPGTGDSSEIGADGSSLGKTINISWYGVPSFYGDAEYLAAYRTVVLPVIKEWQPEMVLVSCGFDAAEGHLPQLGGYNLSPAMFGWMVSEVMKLQNGKIVLALEGGYYLSSVCDSAEQVVKALLDLPLSHLSDKELIRRPNAMAVETLQKVCKVQSPYWKCLEKVNYLSIECSHFEYVTKLADAYTSPPFSSIRCKTEDDDEPMEG